MSELLENEPFSATKGSIFNFHPHSTWLDSWKDDIFFRKRTLNFNLAVFQFNVAINKIPLFNWCYQSSAAISADRDLLSIFCTQTHPSFLYTPSNTCLRFTKREESVMGKLNHKSSWNWEFKWAERKLCKHLESTEKDWKKFSMESNFA